MAIQKFYLHDAATSNTGTLPSGKHSATTDAQSTVPTLKNTQRSMDGTASATAQVTATWSTLANTSAQPTLLRMFESAPLAAQTIAAGNWQLSCAGLEANANANLHFTACVYVWRPGTGAVVGSLIFDTTAAQTGEPGTSQTAVNDTTISGGAVTTAAGDILVCEMWRDATTQGTATARSCTLDYDGTTEASTSSCASFLLAPSSILLATDPVNVVFDAAASSSITSNRNLSFNHTCAAAATKLYVAVIMGLTNDINQTVTVTYDSVSMSDIGAGQKHSNNGANGYVQVFELSNPHTGSALSVAITVTGGGTPGSLIGGAQSYSPASGFALQTGTAATAAVASGTSPITTNLTTTAGNRVAGATGTGTSGEAALLGQTFLVNVNNGTAAGNGAGEDGYAPGGTTAVGFSVVDDSALIAWEIQAVSAGVSCDVAASTTATITATMTASELAAAARSTTATITATLTAAELAAAARSTTATVTAAATAAELAAAALSTTATLTAAATASELAAAAVSTTATITAAATAAELAAAAASTTATITATATVTTGQVTADVAAATTATITAAATAAELAAAARSTTATLTAAMTAVELAAAASSTTATITAAATASELAAAARNTTATITAAATAAELAAAARSTTATLTAAATASAAAAAAVTTTATITAAGTVSTGVAGTPGTVTVSNSLAQAATAVDTLANTVTITSTAIGSCAAVDIPANTVTVTNAAIGSVTVEDSL